METPTIRLDSHVTFCFIPIYPMLLTPFLIQNMSICTSNSSYPKPKIIYIVLSLKQYLYDESCLVAGENMFLCQQNFSKPEFRLITYGSSLSKVKVLILLRI